MLVFGRQHPTAEPWTKAFLVHLGWPPVLWLVCLNSVAIPVKYALLPPTIPNREQLLKRDPVLRASYPRDVQGETETLLLGQDVCYSVCMAYVLVLVGAVWYLHVEL